MKEALVISKQLSQKLYKMGLTRDAEPLFLWLKTGDGHILVTTENYGYEPSHGCDFPALTLQELMELLPKAIGHEESTYHLKVANEDGLWLAGYFNYSNASIYKDDTFSFADEHAGPMQALESLTRWLIENGLLTSKK